MASILAFSSADSSRSSVFCNQSSGMSLFQSIRLSTPLK